MRSSEEELVSRADTALLIGGSRRAGSGEILGSWNPANRRLVDSYQAAAAEDILDAAAAAAAAAAAWAARAPADRAAPLAAWADRIEAAFDDLAAAVVEEIGATISEARADVADGVAALRASTGTDERSRPIGHVGLVTPWVSPAALPLARLAAALSVGNTVVWKPAPYASVVSAKLAALCDDLPDGVFNVVLGDGDTALSLARSHLAGFHVVGTVEAARWLCREALDAGTRVYGEAACACIAIVLADADLESATELVLAAAFRSAGQRSCAVEQVIVETPVLDGFLERLAARAAELRVGDPAETSVEMGPLGDAESARRCGDFVESQIVAGARCHAGGTLLSELGEAFFAPTVLQSFSHDDTVPLCSGPVVIVRGADDVRAVAPVVSAALAAGVLARDLGRAAEIGTALRLPLVRVGSLPRAGTYEALVGPRAPIFSDAAFCPLTQTQELTT